MDIAGPKFGKGNLVGFVFSAAPGLIWIAYLNGGTSPNFLLGDGNPYEICTKTFKTFLFPKGELSR